MKKRIVILTLFFLTAFFKVPAVAENIRVAVADDLKSVTLKSQAGLIIEGREARTEKRIVLDSSKVGHRPVRAASAGAFIQMNGKSYRGRIEVRKKQNGHFLVINDLDIEDYLKGVVAAEIPYDWEVEALKAQAVSSRTYALYRKRTSGSRLYHIVATVDSQVYEGKSGEREATVQAVQATEGLVITYEGKAISAFYHSSCGGHTENAQELWGINASYLRGVECECQRISRYGIWEKKITVTQMSQALQRRGYSMNRVSGIAINGLTEAGRVKQVAIRHSRGSTSLPAEKFRAALGYSFIPSVFFEIDMSGDEIVISGRGLGHGVGLCQWGAKEMAERGYDYASILLYYYPGTVLTREN